MKTELIEISLIKKNPDNPRYIDDHKFGQLVQSIKDFPEMLNIRPIVVNDDMMILGGNMRLSACIDAGLKEVPVIKATQLTQEQQKEFIIKDNVGFGSWDWDKLANEWNSEELEDWGLDMPGFDNNEEEPHKKLTDIFIIPPFSVLDSRQQYWMDRKKQWKALIDDNGESRELVLHNHNISNKSVMNAMKGFSLLDPVLAELGNRCFALDNCKTFDPFAGDSVFGYVSDYIGNTFTGIELRKEQVELNNSRLSGKNSKYICDDGQNVLKHIEENSQDLLFSCPPYYDLEIYSDLKNDASNQGNYEDFIKILRNAFTDSLKCLKDNRFAFIVVSDIRNKQGHYRLFTDHVKNIFISDGLCLYNEMILVESLGTLPQRVGRFMNNRKIGKCHQSILVFYKGDVNQINKIYPKLDFTDIINESENI